MSTRSTVEFLRSIISIALLCAALFAGALKACAECQTSADSINTDRPGFTNSSRVVPYGSFQAENGIDWTSQHGSNVVDGTETRLRLGVAQCTELLADVPEYFYSLNGNQSSGFSDLVVSIKRELPVPLGFHLSVVGGLGFPTGSDKISNHGFDPYFQIPWGRHIGDRWAIHSMFTVTWFTSQHVNNPTFAQTFLVDRKFGSTRDLFVEYAASYPDHARPSQILDAGGTWRVTKLQQLDFEVGFGLNTSSPDHFFGVGYSFRFDGLF
jgi:Putative MetA-pathway of phenol degradation